MINSNILQRVFKISCNDKSGTAFTIERLGVQYLVTAKHLFPEDLPSKVEIGIQLNASIENRLAFVYYHSNESIDICVIKLENDELIGAQNHIEFIDQSFTLSQDCYFLGFPLNLFIPMEGLQSFPVPLVKKGIISGFFQVDNYQLLLLDGINNPGFSGGPVVVIEPKNVMKIVGVISGYQLINRNFVDAKGNIIENGLFWQENSGLVRAWSFKPALDIIDSITN